MAGDLNYTITRLDTRLVKYAQTQPCYTKYAIQEQKLETRQYFIQHGLQFTLSIS